MNFLNSWWALPEKVQLFVKDLVPSKHTWTLNCTKDKSGVWVFSLPQFLTFNESLCNGTEEALDYHYKQLGGTLTTGSKLKLTVTDIEPDDYTPQCLHLYEDPLWTEANYYLDKVSDKDIWLCPYLQVLFKSVPEHLWLTISI